MFLFFIVLMIIIVYWVRCKNPPIRKQEPIKQDDFPREDPKKDFSKSYQRKYLFSVNEKSEFRKLVTWANAHNFYVFPKMRLLDIIEPRSNADNYKALLWKIQAKHVDFVICDQECRIKFIIELDDNSHNRRDRADRDEFVSQALSGAGYKVIHTRAITEEFLVSLLAQQDSI